MEMNKVTVDKETLAAFKAWVDLYGEDAFGMFLDTNKYEWKGDFSLLSNLTELEFMKLAVGHYKVAPQIPDFVGKWVLYRDEYYKVLPVVGNYDGTLYIQKPNSPYFRLDEEFLRKNIKKVVDSEWGVKLLEAGRDAPEFRKGDFVIFENNFLVLTNKASITVAEHQAYDNQVIAVYPSESKIVMK